MTLICKDNYLISSGELIIVVKKQAIRTAQWGGLNGLTSKGNQALLLGV